MKGMELPVNMIIIIAIAVLVLVVITAFFIGGTKPLEAAQYQSAIANSCQAWRSLAPQGTCPPTGFSVRVGNTPEGAPNIVQIGTACEKAYPNRPNPIVDCQQFCACSS